MKFIKKLLLTIFILIIIISGFVIYKGYSLYQKALDEISVKDKIEELRKDKNYVRYNELPKFYLDAVVSTEDRRFYNHGAIDIISIGRAIVENLKEMKLKEGGSTITQQVAKNIYFTQEKTLLRKISEVFMSYEIERQCDKNTILEIYVNTCYFGSGYYGIGEASKGYYDKKPIEMNKYESSMMAGVPNAPSIYAPTKNPDLASQRQRQVLEKMARNEYISNEEIENIINNKAQE